MLAEQEEEARKLAAELEYEDDDLCPCCETCGELGAAESRWGAMLCQMCEDNQFGSECRAGTHGEGGEARAYEL